MFDVMKTDYRSINFQLNENVKHKILMSEEGVAQIAYDHKRQIAEILSFSRYEGALRTVQCMDNMPLSNIWY